MRKIFILIREVTIPHHILINLVESLHVLIILKSCLYFPFVGSFVACLHVYIIPNVLKIGPVTEPKKLSVHGSLVGPVVELRLNR